MNVVFGILFGLAALYWLSLGTNPDEHLRQGLRRVFKELIALVALVFFAWAAVTCLDLLWPALVGDEGWVMAIGLFLGGVVARVLNAASKSNDETCSACKGVHEKPEEE